MENGSYLVPATFSIYREDRFARVMRWVGRKIHNTRLREFGFIENRSWYDAILKAAEDHRKLMAIHYTAGWPENAKRFVDFLKTGE